MAIAGWCKPGGRENICKRSVAVIPVQTRGSVIMIIDEEVDISIAIEIPPDRISEEVQFYGVPLSR